MIFGLRYIVKANLCTLTRGEGSLAKRVNLRSKMSSKKDTDKLLHTEKVTEVVDCIQKLLHQ